MATDDAGQTTGVLLFVSGCVVAGIVVVVVVSEIALGLVDTAGVVDTTMLEVLIVAG